MNQGQLGQNDQYVNQKDQIGKNAYPEVPSIPQASPHTPTVFLAVPDSILQPTDTKPDLLRVQGRGYSQVLRPCRQAWVTALRCTVLENCILLPGQSVFTSLWRSDLWLLPLINQQL